MNKIQYRNAANLNADSDFPYFVRKAENRVFSEGDVGFGVFHWHEDLQFIYCLEGEVCVKTLEEGIVLSAGEGVFTNRGVIHYSIGTSNPCSYRLFRFPERLVSFYMGSPAEKLTRAVTDNPGITVIKLTAEEEWQKRILELLQELVVLEDTKQTDPLYSYNVLTTLAQLWRVMLQNMELTESIRETATGIRMRHFLTFIEGNFQKELSLDELAQAAGVSKSETIRCFRQTLDTTPYRYLMDFRLSKAAEMLEEGALTVSEIAEQVGFHQQSYFGKCFKEKTGMSPLQYRKAKT